MITPGQQCSTLRTPLNYGIRYQLYGSPGSKQADGWSSQSHCSTLQFHMTPRREHQTIACPPSEWRTDLDFYSFLFCLLWAGNHPGAAAYHLLCWQSYLRHQIPEGAPQQPAHESTSSKRGPTTWVQPGLAEGLRNPGLLSSSFKCLHWLLC